MKILRTLQISYNTSWLKIILTIAIIFIIGFSTIDNSGISTDEKIGIDMVYWNRNLILKNKPIPWLFKYDGTVFNIFSEAVFQVRKKINFERVKKHQLQDKGAEQNQFIERIKLKHTLTFLSAGIAYFSVAIFLGIFCGFESGWLAPITLALLPRFWGNSFFNFKDIPFASLFTLLSLAGAYLIVQYVNVRHRIKLRNNKTIIYSVFFGILIGLFTGIRFGGVFVLFFIPISYIILILSKKDLRQLSLPIYLYNFCIFYTLVFASWSITTIVVYPVSWSNPIAWSFEIFNALAKYGWSGTVLFQGQFIAAKSLPWFYLPTWLAMTTPIIFQIGSIGGLIIIMRRFTQFSQLQLSCAIWLLLQGFFIPIVAILRQSTMYDGLRHFLFILPIISVFSSIFLVSIYSIIKNWKIKLFFVAFISIILIAIAFEMREIHPYEYIYFNRASGGLERAHNRHETDYWGLSMREAMEWLNRSVPSNSKVVIGGYLHSVQPFSRPDIQLIPLSKLKAVNLEKPYYYLARPRWDLPQKFPECQIVYEVRRQNTPLTIVKLCNR